MRIQQIVAAFFYERGLYRVVKTTFPVLLDVEPIFCIIKLNRFTRRDKRKTIGANIKNVPFEPISELGENFNPRNTLCCVTKFPMKSGGLKFPFRLGLDQTETF